MGQIHFVFQLVPPSRKNAYVEPAVDAEAQPKVRPKEQASRPARSIALKVAMDVTHQ